MLMTMPIGHARASLAFCHPLNIIFVVFSFLLCLMLYMLFDIGINFELNWIELNLNWIVPELCNSSSNNGNKFPWLLKLSKGLNVTKRYDFNRKHCEKTTLPRTECLQSLFCNFWKGTLLLLSGCVHACMNGRIQLLCQFDSGLGPLPLGFLISNALIKNLTDLTLKVFRNLWHFQFAFNYEFVIISHFDRLWFESKTNGRPT